MRWLAGILSGLIVQLSVVPSRAVWAEEPAAVPLGLEPLIGEALRANPNILAARKRFEAAQANVPRAKALPAPRIGIEFEEIPRGRVRFDQATLMYQLIQSLPFPGKLSLRHQVAVKEAQMAGMAFQQAQWDVLSDLKAVYYDLFLLDREQALRREQTLWVQQAVAAAQARYATGRIGKGELLRLQAEALELTNELAVLGHRRQAMGAHLNHLLNRPAHEPIGAPEAIAFVPLSLAPDELTAIAEERQPELLMFKFSAERAEASWRLAKRELFPDLEAMVELRDPAMGPVGPWDLTLAAAIPFWFWTKWRYGIKVALHDKDSARAAYAAMRNEITRRVHEHWHEAQAAYRSAVVARDGLIPLNRQAVQSLLAGYQAGQDVTLELLEALQALSEQERRYAERLVAYEQHIVMLEEAAGVPLRPEHEAALTGGAS